MRLVQFLEQTSPNLLVEAAKDRYMQMLPDATIQKFFIVPPDPNVVLASSPKDTKGTWEVEVNWAVQNLQRADRITWYLRHIKVYILRSMINVMHHSVMAQKSNPPSEMLKGYSEYTEALPGYEQAYERMRKYVEKELNKLMANTKKEADGLQSRAEEAMTQARAAVRQAQEAVGVNDNANTRSRLTNAERRYSAASDELDVVIIQMGNGVERIAEVYTDPGHPTSMPNLKQQLEHYLSVPVQKIQDFNWGYHFMLSMLRLFGLWEEQWAEKQARNIPEQDPSMKDAEKIIEFPDGLAWWNLHKSWCDKEGKAMGHCGNSYRSGRPVEVISLREPVTTDDGSQTWQVDLTFIWNHDTGFIEESKGYKNQKPDKKYHPYILELIKQPWVKGFNQGGTHAEENNFSVDDLDKETADELKQHNPRLAGYIDEAGWVEGHEEAIVAFPDGSAWFKKKPGGRYIDTTVYELGVSFETEAGKFWKPSLYIKILWGDGALSWMGKSSKKTNDEEEINKLAEGVLRIPEVKGVSSTLRSSGGNTLVDFSEEYQQKILKEKPGIVGAFDDYTVQTIENADRVVIKFKDGSKVIHVDEYNSVSLYALKPIQSNNGELFWLKESGVRMNKSGEVRAFAAYNPFAKGKVGIATDDDWNKIAAMLLHKPGLPVTFLPDSMMMKDSLKPKDIPSEILAKIAEKKPSLISFSSWYEKEGASDRLLKALSRRLDYLDLNHLHLRNNITENYQDGWFANYGQEATYFLQGHVTGDGGITSDIYNRIKRNQEVTPEEKAGLENYLRTLQDRPVIYDDGKELDWIQARFESGTYESPTDKNGITFWIRADKVMDAADGPKGNYYIPHMQILMVVEGMDKV